MQAIRCARHEQGALCLILAPKLAHLLGTQTGDVVRIEPLGDGTFRLIPSGTLQPNWAQRAVWRFRRALRELARTTLY